MLRGCQINNLQTVQSCAESRLRVTTEIWSEKLRNHLRYAGVMDATGLDNGKVYYMGTVNCVVIESRPPKIQHFKLDGLCV